MKERIKVVVELPEKMIYSLREEAVLRSESLHDTVEWVMDNTLGEFKGKIIVVKPKSYLMRTKKLSIKICPYRLKKIEEYPIALSKVLECLVDSYWPDRIW